MQALFTYGGNRKSALTPRTLLYGNSPARGERFRFGANNYSPTYAYDAYPVVGAMPYTPAQVALMADVSNIMTLDAANAQLAALASAIAQFTDYRRVVSDYYGKRIGRMDSGGKERRLRQERADLSQTSDRSLELLKTAHATLTRAMTGMATSRQPDFDPTTGKNKVVVPGLTPDPSTDSGFKASTLILPVGAALAALYFLKGN